jgi:hypothetical protein
MSKQVSAENLEGLLTQLSTDSPMLLKLFGFTGNYEADSLDSLEEMIKTLYPVDGPAKFDTTYLPLGFYLGETIIRNIPGAKWELEAVDHIGEIGISIPQAEKSDGVLKVFPFNRVRNFFLDHTDGLTVLFRMVLAMSLNLLSTTADGEWVELPNGDKYRMSTKPFTDKD